MGEDLEKKIEKAKKICKKYTIINAILCILLFLFGLKMMLLTKDLEGGLTLIDWLLFLIMTVGTVFIHILWIKFSKAYIEDVIKKCKMNNKEDNYG